MSVIKIPENILCVCNENTVRSVMLQALLSSYTKIDSVGIDPVSFFNPITKEVIALQGFNFTVVDPVGFEDIDVKKYDLIIAVSETAYAYMRDNNTEKTPLEYWTTSIPPMLGEVSRDACVESYTMILSELIRHIENRFGFTPE